MSSPSSVYALGRCARVVLPKPISHTVCPILSTAHYTDVAQFRYRNIQCNNLYFQLHFPVQWIRFRVPIAVNVAGSQKCMQLTWILLPVEGILNCTIAGQFKVSTTDPPVRFIICRQWSFEYCNKLGGGPNPRCCRTHLKWITLTDCR